MDDPRFWILVAFDLGLVALGLHNHWCCRRNRRASKDEEFQQLRQDFKENRDEIRALIASGINVTVTRVMEGELKDGPQGA